VRRAIAGLDLPNNPLDQLIDMLGGPPAVAEMTGRKGRLVRIRNGEAGVKVCARCCGAYIGPLSTLDSKTCALDLQATSLCMQSCMHVSGTAPACSSVHARLRRS
jgi:hypothetical protein